MNRDSPHKLLPGEYHIGGIYQLKKGKVDITYVTNYGRTIKGS